MPVQSPHRANPGADIDSLVAVVNQLAALTAQLKAKHNALLAKLDADAGVTDVNYASTQNVTVADSDTITLSY